MKAIRYFLGRGYAPRWLILQIDMVFCLFSVLLSYLLRFNFDLNNADVRQTMLPAIGIFLCIRFLTFYGFKTYHGVVRYTSTQDAKRIFAAVSSGSLLVAMLNVASFYYYGQSILPYSIIVFEYFATAMIMISFRIFVKIVYAEIKDTTHTEKKNVLVFGAGESGLITKRTIDQDKDSGRRIIGFLDDDALKTGKTLEGVKIYNLEANFPELVSKYKIDELIIAVQDLSRERKETVVDLCLKHKIHLKTVPKAAEWVGGEFTTRQINDIKIEDLLEREPIHLDQERIHSQINDKRVMITGACGSIGSELIRQIIRFYPGQLILVDQAETPFYELELDLREHSNYIDSRFIVADIRNYKKLDKIFSTYKPDIIYHAAAYKHVPLMEENPVEAVKTNVQGTKNLADLAVKHGVKDFVFISTDKAVNPTNVMGASKRIAEIYVQSLNTYFEKQNIGHTRFITTRFGNVLGSNGSVIPRFRKQIEIGGPVTVTHPEICRFFMTIPEACQLILEAGMMGKGGEIFLFDMGEPVKIIDLAKKMIILSGLKPGKDIQVVFTGLRPGEKIKEELLNTKERTLPTHHSKIMIGRVHEYPFQVVEREINELLELTEKHEDKPLVAKMKTIVPEFISNNSIYAELDQIDIPQEISSAKNINIERLS